MFDIPREQILLYMIKPRTTMLTGMLRRLC